MASLPFKTIPNSNPVSSRPSIPTQTLQTSQAHFPPSKSYFTQISTLSKQSQIQEAVNLLIQIDLPNGHIAPEIYGELLQACVYDRALQTGQKIHARIIKKGQTFSTNEYIETKLVIFYAKCDAAKASSSLFRRVRVRNVFSWAAVIGLNCRLGCYKEALLGFIEMHEDGLSPDNFVVPNVLKACGAGEWIGVGRGVHGFVVKMGLDECVFVSSSLVDMYGKCGVLIQNFMKVPE